MPCLGGRLPKNQTKVSVVRDKAPHFLRGPRLQPAEPIRKSGPGCTGMCQL